MCTADAIEKSASQLIAGHLVAFPTETVYGLGADASNPEAVRRIYEVKGRPVDHPLIVHISSMHLLDVWATDIPEYAIKLARGFWPGPMTLVLKRTSEAKDFITGGQDSVGLRVPNNSIALSLLRSFESKGGKGVAAPSANRFGQVSPTSADDVISELNSFLMDGDLILDGGVKGADIFYATRNSINIFLLGQNHATRQRGANHFMAAYGNTIDARIKIPSRGFIKERKNHAT